MDDVDRANAAALRHHLAHKAVLPADFRAALLRIGPNDRDAWVDVVLGLDGCPDDGAELPRGCVPYLPCSVDVLLRVVEHAGVTASDVFVDVGSGVGRAAALVHLLSGAETVGLELQSALIAESRALARRLDGSAFSVIEGDAARLVGSVARGTVFFLYCPFSGERLERALDELAPIAEAHPIRICSVDLPLPKRPWLVASESSAGDLTIYRSVRVDGSHHPSPMPENDPQR